MLNETAEIPLQKNTKKNELLKIKRLDKTSELRNKFFKTPIHSDN